MNEKQIDLWEKVGNGCLNWAAHLLDNSRESADGISFEPAKDRVEMIGKLVDVAIRIDARNFLQIEQNAPVFSLDRAIDIRKIGEEVDLS